MKIADVLYNM